MLVRRRPAGRAPAVRRTRGSTPGRAAPPHCSAGSAAGGRSSCSSRRAGSAGGDRAAARSAEARAPEQRRAAVAARGAGRGGGGANGAEQDVELVDARLEADQLGAALEQQVLTEAVAPVHLQRQPAEVAQLLLTETQERLALAPEL